MPAKEKQEKMFRCDILNCNSEFKTKYSLKRHMKMHKVKKDWKCKICKKQFSLK